MELFLTALSGIAWTIVYIDAIRIGFRQKTYAMPLAALGLNFAWESTYSVLDFTGGAVSVQAWVNLVWALADVVIVFTFFKFGRAELPQMVTKPMFIVWGVLIFASSFAVQWLFIAEFGQMPAARYSAFLQNLLMSGLFIAMLVARRGIRGQTLTIAISKWIGTLAPTILIGVLGNMPFITAIGLMCSVFDLIYIALVVRARRHPDATAGGEAIPAGGASTTATSEASATAAAPTL
jgi:hypothetical protein